VLEQPCRTYAECASVRHAADRPLVLDESIVTLDDLLRAHRERVADGITIKLQRVGGITKAVLMRDVAAELGLEVTVEDAGGASLVTAAITHVGLGTPERYRVHTCDFHM
jgi:L-alanine-DL-glutamate epimerase-like enolase superfamily enzyme